jgi:hypothetical protein
MKAHFPRICPVHCVAVALTIVTANVGAGYTGVLAGQDKTALIDCGGKSAGAAVDALSRVPELYRWPWWGALVR